jgi:hypothetical protein
MATAQGNILSAAAAHNHCRLGVNRVVPTMRRRRRLNPNDQTRRPAKATSPSGQEPPLALQNESAERPF